MISYVRQSAIYVKLKIYKNKVQELSIKLYRNTLRNPIPRDPFGSIT